jgi:phosphoribosylformimino-5-aminoimidazole carboxamide ribotide isomerase
VRSTTTVAELIALGLERVVVGTQAVEDAAWFAGLCRQYPGRVCLGLDARDGRVATEGWTNVSERPAIDLARGFDELPLAAIIYTDISRDGMMRGVNLGAVGDMVRAIATPLIASGGVTTLDDVRELAKLRIGGCIVGRSLYEGRITLADAIQAANSATNTDN